MILTFFSCSEERVNENHVKVLKKNWSQQKEKEKSDLFTFNSYKYVRESEKRMASGAYQDYIFLKRNLNLDEGETRLTITRSDFEDFLYMTDSITNIENSKKGSLQFDKFRLDIFFNNRSRLNYNLLLNQLSYFDKDVFVKLISTYRVFCGVDMDNEGFGKKVLSRKKECSSNENNKDSVDLLVVMDLISFASIFPDSSFYMNTLEVYSPDKNPIEVDHKKFKRASQINFLRQDTGMYTVKSKIKVKLNLPSFEKRYLDTIYTIDQKIPFKVY